MKITTIYHPDEETKKERKNDLLRTRVSKNPLHHPFMKERELIRAVNSAKLDRLFAKPFITAFSYHKEGIQKMVGHPAKDCVLTLSFDDNIILSDLKSREMICSLDMKKRVSGIGIDAMDNLYVGFAKSVKRLNDEFVWTFDSPISNVYVDEDLCVSTYKCLNLYDRTRRDAKMRFDIENTTTVVCNKIFSNLIACSAGTMNYILDTRYNKTVMEYSLPEKTNQMCFNPVDAHYLSAANEDTNGYINDLRFIKNPCNVLRGHVSAVTSIKYNPTGKELCTGSYDKTVRVFRSHERKSRDVYYNDRMQHVSSVEYSKDGQFIVSASDDGSIRLWKSEASATTELSRREKDNQKYSKALIAKYKNVEEVDRISRHRFLPRLLKSKMKQKNEHYQAEVRKGHIKTNKN